VPRFPGRRCKLLLFGELTARKGVLRLLDACLRLDAATAARAALIIAGRIDPGLREAVALRARELYFDWAMTAGKPPG